MLQQSSAKLGLTAAVTKRLFAEYALPALPDTVLAHFALESAFVDSIDVMDYSPPHKDTFDIWYWAARVAASCRR